MNQVRDHVRIHLHIVPSSNDKTAESYLRFVSLPRVEDQACLKSVD